MVDSEGEIYSSIKKAYDSRNKLAGHRASMKEYNKIWMRDANSEVNTIEDARGLLEGIVMSISNVFDKVRDSKLVDDIEKQNGDIP